MQRLIYLEHDQNGKVAGWYPDKVARVLLSVGHGWSAPSAPQPDDPAPDAALDQMTVKQLRALADARGVELGEARKKAEILALLEDPGDTDVPPPAGEHTTDGGTMPAGDQEVKE